MNEETLICPICFGNWRNSVPGRSPIFIENPQSGCGMCDNTGIVFKNRFNDPDLLEQWVKEKME